MGTINQVKNKHNATLRYLGIQKTFLDDWGRVKIKGFKILSPNCMLKRGSRQGSNLQYVGTWLVYFFANSRTRKTRFGSKL